ncbi:hypothetical protein FH972_022242 [Carpinus fangiana]|uniref:Endoplasmic reticulum vesicle transporter C-terminal domain-containing protein n=1 Tax=Carpinus fangiana TaxID=176857 RepID=A0A5N6KS84_9ROSI|nr:hypothetical protein FH972_022242 [Carpinus fangiana]
MNGFSDQGLNEDNFGGSSALAAVKAFDAFRECFTTACLHHCGHDDWSATVTDMEFFPSQQNVEKGVAHDLQINLDVVVSMPCADLHINVQDASGDRIMAGDLLTKDRTNWAVWSNSATNPTSFWGKSKANAGWGAPENWKDEQKKQYTEEEDVHDFLSAAKGRRRFARTPKLRGVQGGDACRIYGNIEGNKVQGDFHITARGHGYNDMGQHIDHKTFNFSHHINELSFGPFFPSLHNPLDSTELTTDEPFYKYQYYLSVVPTIYTDVPHKLDTSSPPSRNTKNFNPYAFAPHTIFTNQYAVTEQSHSVPEMAVPGIFVKYDIEPIMLMVSEEWGGLLGLLVKIVNVVAGVLVAGGWLVMLVEYAGDGIWGRKRGASVGSTEGLLHGRNEKKM